MKIFIANSPAEAHLAHQQLQAQGIDCEVRGESLFGLRGEVPFDDSTLPYVWLLDNRQDTQAKQVLLNWQQSLSKARLNANWKCPACSEANEAQFNICWNCLQPKP